MTSALATISDNLGKLIRLFSSDRDSEVIAAAHAIRRALQGAGLDVHALAGPKGWRKTALTKRKRASSTTPDTSKNTTLPRTATSATDSTTSMARCCPGIGQCAGASSITNICDPKSVRLLIRWPRKPSEKQGKWLKSIYYRLGGK
jgi:hypothetical protein